MFQPIISPEKVVKTFVFEKEDTQQSTIMNYEVNLLNDRVNLMAVLDRHCPLTEHRVSIYNPSNCKFVSLLRLRSQNGFIPKYLFEPAVVMIRFIQKGSLIIDSQSYNSLAEGDEKSADQREGRSKERTIGQVLQVVKKWRELHLHGHTALRKRLNLQDAAKLVGISKKSLDDYYCQLRLGEQYHFDYVNNFNEKMGVLRTYVKNYRPQKQQSRRRQNDKHPKNLKILNYYDLASHHLKNVEQLLQEEEYMILSQPQEQKEEDAVKEEPLPQKLNISQILEPLSGFVLSDAPVSKELFNLQHQFFKGFDIPLDEEGDPYYQLEKDIRKQQMDFDSNSFMFLD